jgi:hypothetical protein
MNTDALKSRLQYLLTDGLVTIVGTGLSCAEGLPVAWIPAFAGMTVLFSTPC